jgi:hypothetical protein
VGVRRESLRRDSGRSASGPRLRRSRICGRGPRRGPSGSGRSKVPPGWVVCSRSRRTRPDAPWPVQGRFHSPRCIAGSTMVKNRWASTLRSKVRPAERIRPSGPERLSNYGDIFGLVVPDQLGPFATSAHSSGRHSRRSLDHLSRVRCDCRAVALWTCPRAGRLRTSSTAPTKSGNHGSSSPFQPLAGQMVADEVFL